MDNRLARLASNMTCIIFADGAFEWDTTGDDPQQAAHASPCTHQKMQDPVLNRLHDVLVANDSVKYVAINHLC